nr:hypothetical protein CFP56_11720 [Quercus suber]
MWGCGRRSRGVVEGRAVEEIATGGGKLNAFRSFSASTERTTGVVGTPVTAESCIRRGGKRKDLGVVVVAAGVVIVVVVMMVARLNLQFNGDVGVRIPRTAAVRLERNGDLRFAVFPLEHAGLLHDGKP